MNTGTVEILEEDITTLEIDMVVNVANKTILGKPGVEGAIHNVAGSKLLNECRQVGGCLTGEARNTMGYGHPARFPFHQDRSVQISF